MDTNECRLCSSNDNTLIDVFENSSDDTSLATKIHLCFGVKILKEDVISKKICKHCFYFSNTAYEHRITSQRRDVLLKSKYQELQNNKNNQLQHMPDMSISISQDAFLNSLHLTSTSLSSKRDMHQSIEKILYKYPKVKIPSSCLQENMLPRVILNSANALQEKPRNFEDSDIRDNFSRINNELLSSCHPQISKPEGYIHDENSTYNRMENSSIQCLRISRSKTRNASRKRSMSEVSSDEEVHLEKRKQYEMEGYKKYKNAESLINANRSEITPSKPVEDNESEQLKSNFPTISFMDSNITSNGQKINTSLSSDNLLTVGLEFETFICQTCNTVFDNMELLSEHQRMTHKSSLRCSLCSKKCDGVEELLNHNKNIHTNVKVVLHKLTEEQILLFSRKNSTEEGNIYSENLVDMNDSNVCTETDRTIIHSESNSPFLIMGCKSLLQAALTPQILAENKFNIEPQQNTPFANRSIEKNNVRENNVNVTENEQVYIICESDVEDDIMLVSELENSHGDLQSSAPQSNMLPSMSDMKCDYTDEEHAFVNSTFRKCRKNILENRKNRKWILKNFTKLSERCIIPIDLQFGNEFSVKYALKSRLDPKVNVNNTWDTASAVRTYRDEMPIHTRQVLTLEPFLTLHRDVQNKPTASVDHYTLINHGAKNVSATTLSTSVPIHSDPISFSTVAPAQPLSVTAPQSLVNVPSPAQPPTESSAELEQSLPVVPSVSPQVSALDTSTSDMHKISKSTSDQITESVLKPTVQTKNNDDEAFDAEGHIKTTTIYRIAQPKTITVDSSEHASTANNVSQSTARNIIDTAGSSAIPIVLNGLPFPVISNIKLSNNSTNIVQMPRAPITPQNSVLLLPSVSMAVQNEVQVTSPSHTTVCSTLNTTTSSDKPKPYIRIRNLSELTGKNNEDTNRSQSLREMYTKTLSKYVSNNPNSIVNTYKNSDEYLQIS